MKKINGKICLAFVAALFAVSLLGGCKGLFGGNTDGLQIWLTAPLISDYKDAVNLRPNDRNAKLTKLVMDKFYEKHPDAKVSLYSPGWGADMNEALISANNSRSLPDIVAEEPYLKAHQTRGILLPLAARDNVAAEYPELARINAKWLDDVSINGQIYSAPVFTGGAALHYNENILRQYDCFRPDPSGVSLWLKPDGTGTNVKAEAALYVPKTFSELYEASETVYTNSGGAAGGCLFSYVPDGASAYLALGFMRQAGAEIYDAALGETDSYGIALNTAQSKAVFNYLNQLGRFGLTRWAGYNTEAALNNAYGDGEAAFFMSASVALYDLRLQDFVSHGGNSANYRYAGFKMTDIPECDINGRTIGGITFAGDAVPAPQRSNVLIGNLSFALCKSKNNEDPEKLALAKDFLNILMSDEIQNAFFDYAGRLPVVDEVAESMLAGSAAETFEQKVRQENKAVLRSLREDVFRGTIPSFNSRPADMWSAWTAFYRDVTKQGSQYSAKAGVDGACDDVTADLAWYIRNYS